jgi:glycosyltransferase involved in cell wall biosynthesis
MATELTKRGHDVTLFGHPDSDPVCRIVAVEAAEKAGFLGYSLAMYRAMQLVEAGDFDVVHNNGIHFLPPLLARTLPFLMVTTLHTPPYRSHRLTGEWSRYLTNHRYVSISHLLAEQWQPYVGKATVIHNGLDLSVWPYSPIAEPRTAVWYGRLSPEKGAEYAIAAARAAGYGLTLAGPISDADYFAAKIRPELSGDIRYAGHLTQAELATIVGQSAVGIVTSVWEEPFGLVYAEMLACGTPVAGFDSGAAREIVSSQCGTLVAKRDVVALTRVLGEVEESRERAVCRAHVEANFPVAKMVEAYLNLYHRLAQPSGK